MFAEVGTQLMPAVTFLDSVRPVRLVCWCMVYVDGS